MKQTFVSLVMASLLVPFFHVSAIEVAAVPVGFVTVNIAAGTGTIASDTFLSLPLLASPEGEGQVKAKLTAVSSNTISNSQGGWTSGAFAVAGSPYFVRITSGAAVGRMFVISGNTSTSLTVDTGGVDISSLGIATNTDTYEIFPGDTFLSVFGSPSASNPIVGGTSQNGAVDKVYVLEGGVWVSYFYNTSVSQWRRGTLPLSQNNKVLNPGSPILYSRIGNTGLSFTLTGRVPDTSHVITVNTNGDSGVAAFFPVDQTLSSFGFQNMPGWKKVGDAGITSTNADKVHLFEGGVWVSYHYNQTASQWRRGSLPISQNGKIILAGTGLILQRTGSIGLAAFTVNLPYSLN